MGFMSALSCVVLWRHSFHCLFSAVYLATILTLSTLSILIVIWLAKMASSEEEMSSCSRSLALCFAKISCCNRRSCCCRKSNAATKTRKGEVYENGAGFFFYKYDRRPHNENAPEYDNDDAITWQDFASHLDRCFFVIFFFIIILASLVLFIIWGIEYEKISSWKELIFIFLFKYVNHFCCTRNHIMIII